MRTRRALVLATFLFAAGPAFAQQPAASHQGLAKLLRTMRNKPWARLRRLPSEQSYRQTGGEGRVVVLAAHVWASQLSLSIYRVERGGALAGGVLGFGGDGTLAKLRLFSGHVLGGSTDMRSGKLAGDVLLIRRGESKTPDRVPFDGSAVPLSACLFLLPALYDLWPKAKLRAPVYAVPAMALGGRGVQPPRRLKGDVVLRRAPGSRPGEMTIRLSHPELGKAEVRVSTLAADRGRVRYVKGFGGEVLLPIDRAERRRLIKAEGARAAHSPPVVANEASAIAALRTIRSGQSLFREGDKDGNGKLDYAGDLGALGKANLIAKTLASGTLKGYRFKLTRSTKAPELRWMASASPLEPGKSGIRHFAINHAGAIRHTLRPFAHTDDCQLGAIPLNKPIPGYPSRKPKRPGPKVATRKNTKAERARVKREIRTLSFALKAYRFDVGRYPRMARRPTGLKDAEAALADDGPVLYAALQNKATRATGGGPNSPYIHWKSSRVAIVDPLFLKADTMAEAKGFALTLLRPDQADQLGTLAFQQQHGPTSKQPLVLLDPWGSPYHYREWASVRASTKDLMIKNPKLRAVTVGGKTRKVKDHPHTPARFDIWSNGPNGINEYGAPDSDDVATWR